MATIINTPAPQSSDGSAAGWAVAVVILLAVGLVALFVWPGYVRRAAPADTTPSANINVTLPGGNTDTGGSDGSAAQ